MPTTDLGIFAKPKFSAVGNALFKVVALVFLLGFLAIGTFRRLPRSPYFAAVGESYKLFVTLGFPFVPCTI